MEAKSKSSVDPLERDRAGDTGSVAMDREPAGGLYRRLIEEVRRRQLHVHALAERMADGEIDAVETSSHAGCRFSVSSAASAAERDFGSPSWMHLELSPRKTGSARTNTTHFLAVT